jgi:hypothetical protein
MIWLSNTDPLQSPYFETDWLRGNIVDFYLDEKLWEEENVDDQVAVAPVAIPREVQVVDEDEDPFDWPPTPLPDLFHTPPIAPVPQNPAEFPLSSQTIYLEDLNW